jgi:hypothetical protein
VAGTLTLRPVTRKGAAGPKVRTCVDAAVEKAQQAAAPTTIFPMAFINFPNAHLTIGQTPP